jgi:hypothetical protein
MAQHPYQLNSLMFSQLHEGLMALPRQFLVHLVIVKCFYCSLVEYRCFYSYRSNLNSVLLMP